ncbi:adenylate/guanylate cyclase domain-containing protein [Roseibium denhamense]|uniref:Adenylate cyclase, class 3 n=1 Tax=Roseibium denhamense TaxID=76305 RepID=A0ABY1PI48_9HYPH|nr:adenylate/guanylate cyclase domain-containing protein [Roseibium denhamense]SMP33778.1 Adenylate cyclase, class 3 [Roseibium denhamense]
MGNNAAKKHKKSDPSQPRDGISKAPDPGPAGQEDEIQALRAELDDLKLLYEATIEHGEAVEDQLADQSAHLEALSKQLAKYLSPQVYQSIFEGRQEVKITATRKKLTVFFSDIADFTETADRLESEELTAILNQYLTEMSRIALKHGATIDKYVGDAILIFFGDPDTRGVTEDALACVRMAIEMQKRMSELQMVWMEAGISKPLKCRMGIHTDYCTVGNFGSEDRLDYTIIGRGVNTASRLEALSNPGSILISFETYSQVKNHIVCRENGDITVKGIAYPVTTFEVLREKAVIGGNLDGRLLEVSRQLEDVASDLAEDLSKDERTKLLSALKSAFSDL